MAAIIGGLHYPSFILFSKKSKFLHKSGHINWLKILSMDIFINSHIIERHFHLQKSLLYNMCFITIKGQIQNLTQL